MQGKFIVIEGLEGAGKSTAMQTVVDALKSLGVNDIVFTREPGGTPLAEKLRYLIKHETEEPVTDKAELLMLYAARIQLVENVIVLANVIWNWCRTIRKPPLLMRVSLWNKYEQTYKVRSKIGGFHKQNDRTLSLVSAHLSKN